MEGPRELPQQGRSRLSRILKTDILLRRRRVRRQCLLGRDFLNLGLESDGRRELGGRVVVTGMIGYIGRGFYSHIGLEVSGLRIAQSSSLYVGGYQGARGSSSEW